MVASTKSPQDKIVKISRRDSLEYIELERKF